MYKYIRITILVITDAILLFGAMYSSLLLRFEGKIPEQYLASFFELIPYFIIISIFAFYFSGLYRRVWEYASIGEMFLIITSSGIASLLDVALAYFLMEVGRFPLPRSIFILNWILLVFLIGGSRLAWRIFRDYKFKVGNNLPKRNVLIVGAGNSGSILARELTRSETNNINIVGFIDDDPVRHHLKIRNISILGDRHEIERSVRKYNVEQIILAIPSASGKTIKELVDICARTEAEIKILPGMQDIIEGNVTVSHIREVKIEDLLGREQIKTDIEAISQYLQDKVVLVTGAGGSIGSELCRQISCFNPDKLLLFDVSENNIYDIEMELKKLYPANCYIPLVKDVRDRQAVDDVFEKYCPTVVFHAAAHKHVPLMEANPEEAIKNNVGGTYNVARAADKYGAERFILVSTDKAVNPTSVMGASKRVAEMIIQHFNQQSKTSFAAVRFGNVLGSRGSVVPLFQKQIKEGGPVTVTDPEMQRYFMVIPEAVELIIQAGALSAGGEIFVLDMGEPVKIIDLAETLIRLSGFEPYKDIEIIFTGLRPGEKMFEELLTAAESVDSTSHKRIFIAKLQEKNKELIDLLIEKIGESDLPINREDCNDFLRLHVSEFSRL